jgi:hypothetical protein
MNAFPTGRRRKVATATTTTASVPSELAAIATTRGSQPRWSWAAGISSPNCPCTGIARPIPTAKPA